MTPQEKARQEIAALIAKYQSLDEKAIKKFTEADTRRVFILPLFNALGWNVYSREEVTEEERASRGRVDYAFKLREVTRFYLEAKALRADLNKQEFAKQIITYAYGKGITWAVLTDFEGLKVFNAQTGRMCLNLSYQDYLSDFSELWLLSRESFENNELDRWAERHGFLPTRMRIEQRLFNQLRQWREELYTQIYHYNPELTFEQIDETIQRLFNRLIFIRTCEDRRIEERVLLGALHEWQSNRRKGEFIEVLRRIFRDFDGYYDSDLFALHLVDQVFVEGMTLEGIIEGLYDVPGLMASYDFDVIDADVLGAVYEQYLGHVATVAKEQVKKARLKMNLGMPSDVTFEVTSKKQRRKAQGIYYTPKFITNYIVKETVGRFLQEHSYNEALKLKVLDMSCGSGSFLIRAYDELLNYHAEARSKAVSELDQYERLPVLTGNIFGVDLDMQAVEIARLNLLLRSLARRELLPSLAGNIRQGNALISGTDKELRAFFGKEWREKKPFNWEREFPQIIEAGGFDVVIGNPPYVSFGLRGAEKKISNLMPL